MGVLNKLQKNPGLPPKKIDNIEKTYDLSAANEQEATMATVMMTRIHDASVEDKFNRLMLMGQNDQVTATYPLNRKVTQVGRSRQNDIRLEDPLVSVKHLSVSVSGSACVANDLKSSNGTFINGERLDGARVLKDGEEIIIGKSVLRFAARRGAESEPKSGAHGYRPVGAKKRRSGLMTASLMVLFISTAIIYLVINIASQNEIGKPVKPVAALQKKKPVPPAIIKNGKVAVPALEANKSAAITLRKPKLPEASPVQHALEDYRAGRIESAVESLGSTVAASDNSFETAEAKRILSKINNIRKLHSKALMAQNKNKFTEALGFWDHLLKADMELVGERPSFFAIRAEQTVQTLTYEQAKAAYKAKKTKKAGQLCRIILQIDPGNKKAAALLAKIEYKN